MSELAEKIIPVIIDEACNQWDNDELIQLFGRMCGLKMKGYGTKYPDGVLPIDTTDFIGGHVLACLQTEDGLRPIMGHKTIDMSSCFHYRVEFPGLSLVKRAGGQKHVKAVEEIMRLSEEEKSTLVYSGSWTIDPDFHMTRQDRIALREIFEAIYTHYLLSKKARHSMLGGTLRFKTEKVFQRMGYRALALNGESLPHIEVSHLRGEPVQVLYTDQLNFYALQRAKQYETWWNDRKLVFSSTDSSDEYAKKTA